MPKLIVGQKLWLVPSQRCYGAPRDVSVVSIGRKWATLNIWQSARIDLDSLCVEGRGCTSPGCCYLSREEHEVTMKLRDVWNDFRKRVEGYHDRPEVATEANIRLAADLLGIQLLQE